MAAFFFIQGSIFIFYQSHQLGKQAWWHTVLARLQFGSLGQKCRIINRLVIKIIACNLNILWVAFYFHYSYSRTSLFWTRLIRCPRYFKGGSNALRFTLPLDASPVISKPRYFELFFHFPWDFEIAGFDCTKKGFLLTCKVQNIDHRHKAKYSFFTFYKYFLYLSVCQFAMKARRLHFSS